MTGRPAAGATSRVGRWLRARRGVDKHLAVYGAYWFRGYSCNPRAIYEKARELVPECRGVWVVRRNDVDKMPPASTTSWRGRPSSGT